MTLRLNGSTSGYVNLDCAAAGGNNTLVLPSSNGSNRQSVITDAAGSLSFQWNAGSLFYRLNSNYVGSNATGAQSVFGVGATLEASTVYAFEMHLQLQKTAGTTSHNLGLLFGGTATTNNFNYSATSVRINTATTGDLGGGSPPAGVVFNTTLNNLNYTTGVTSAAVTFVLILRGTISVNASGTFIPQYQLSAAPGGAYSTLAGSYINALSFKDSCLG